MSNSQEIPYHHQLKIVFVATSLSSLMWKQRDLMQKDALLELAAITFKMDENGNLQPDQNAIFILNHLRGRILILNLSNLMGLIFTIHYVVPYLN